MGERERAAGQRMKARYARTFGVPKHDILVEEFLDERGNEDVRVSAPQWYTPAWTLGAELT